MKTSEMEPKARRNVCFSLAAAEDLVHGAVARDTVEQRKVVGKALRGEDDGAARQRLTDMLVAAGCMNASIVGPELVALLKTWGKDL